MPIDPFASPASQGGLSPAGAGAEKPRDPFESFGSTPSSTATPLSTMGQAGSFNAFPPMGKSPPGAGGGKGDIMNMFGSAGGMQTAGASPVGGMMVPNAGGGEGGEKLGFGVAPTMGGIQIADSPPAPTQAASPFTDLSLGSMNLK